MTTLKHTITEDQDRGLQQGEFLASRPVEPGSREARKMTAGSGTTLCGLFQKHDPLGVFSKILLESETWASPEFFLEWRHRVTRCGCSVFQLAPLVARRDGSDIGSWPTPASRDVKSPQASQETLDKNARPLNEILYAAWPTPNCMDEIIPRRDLQAMDPKGHWGKAMNTGKLCDTLNTILLGDMMENYQTPISEIVSDNGHIPSGCLARTEKFVARLMTLSAWLMGYTAAYLERWETASSHKSRRESYKP